MAELRRLNGTPKEVLEHPELMELMIPLLRADFEVCQTYKPTDGPPLSCPIHAFGGLQDEDIPREHVEAWRNETTGSFELGMYPGDHFFLHNSEPALLEALNQNLRQLTDKLY
jgi:medium-chain acyl-[acyl-carrier-protein] hydrolase